MSSELLNEFSTELRRDRVRPLRRAVAELAAQAGADERVVADVELCVDEALANVVRHAYGRGEGPIELVVSRTREELEVLVRDRGRGVAPHRAGHLGLGLEIINRLTRRCSIDAAPGGGTEVRMNFALGA